MPIPNPYAFIPLRSRPVRSSLEKGPDPLLSGSLDVRLITKTKLMIPESQPLNPDSDHKVYNFYRLQDGTPVIPGSEIRGMLRSAYEAASNSCMGVIYDDKDTRIDLRVPVYAAFKNRGLLELRDGVWQLWKTQDYKAHVEGGYAPSSIETDGQFQRRDPGARVFFYLNEDHEAVLTQNSQDAAGYLQFSNPISRRNYHPRVLVPIGDAPIYQWTNEENGSGSDEPYQILRHELDHAGDSARSTQNDGAEAVHRNMIRLLDRIHAKGHGMIPVWYLMFDGSSGKTCHLSPSSVGRVNQVRRWKDIVGEYRPCEDRSQSCPACQLFGFIGAKSSACSHIRISDAKPVAPIPDEQFQSVTLPILSSPKPSAFEFYINRPDPQANYWNFDFYFIKNTGEFLPQTALTPRGRKFYWHGNEWTEIATGNQNNTIEALNAGNEFVFRIYFDQISQKQLDELIWIVTLGENDVQSPFWHKLGHGRPVGYGSVKLTVERISLRQFAANTDGLDYSVAFPPVPRKPDCPFSRENETAIFSLLQISNAHARPAEDVRYPTGGDGMIYSWFVQNRSHAQPQVLPSILDTAGQPDHFYYAEEWQAENEPAAAPANQLQPGQIYQGRIEKQPRIKGIYEVLVGENKYNISLSGRQPDLRNPFQFKVLRKEEKLIGTVYICQPA